MAERLLKSPQHWVVPEASHFLHVSISEFGNFKVSLHYRYTNEEKHIGIVSEADTQSHKWGKRETHTERMVVSPAAFNVPFESKYSALPVGCSMIKHTETSVSSSVSHHFILPGLLSLCAALSSEKELSLWKDS